MKPEFSRIVSNYPDSLEARIILYLDSRRTRLQSVSSEFQARANLPVQCTNRDLKILENLESELRWNFRKKLPFHVLFSLACLSWWIDEEDYLGPVIRLLVEQEKMRFPHKMQELEIVLHSKAETLLFLQEKFWNREGDIFSSIITLRWSWIDKHTGKNVTRSFFEIYPRTFWNQKKKPKKVQRKRGYSDHGTLGDQDKRVRREEWKKDYLNRKEEEEIEENRRERESLFKLLLGWFQ